MSDDVQEILPNPSFRAELATAFGRKIRDARIFDDRETPTFQDGVTDLVVATTPLNDCGWAELHAYMHRRFGSPPTGGDPYKELCGSWFLTTPDPDVFLRVRPSLSGSVFSFNPYVASDLPVGAREPVMPPEWRASVAAAYLAALLDLLRPVAVGDSHVNALGRVVGDSALLTWNETTSDYLFAVDRDPSAGFGTPPGLVGGEDWGRFCALLRHLGNGDTSAGRSVAVGLMTDAVLAEALDHEPLEVRMLAAVGTGRRFDDRLVSPQEWAAPDASARVEGLEALLDESERAITFPIDLDTAARAAALVDLLAPEADFTRRLRRARDTYRVGREWEAMREAFDDADFPDSCIPGRWPSEKDIDDLPARLETAGAPRTAVEWSARLSASHGGTGVIERILVALAAQRKKAAEDEASGPKP